MRIMDHVGHVIFYFILAVLLIAGLIWYLRARISVKPAIAIAQVESQAFSLFGQVLLMCYFAMGVIQLTAAYGFLYDHWGWPFIFASAVSIVFSFVPVVGSLLGFAGAVLHWGWDWTGALLLFFWWPVVYAIAVRRFGLRNWFGKDMLKH